MAGIYIHIPFCKTRCSYCDFYSSTQEQWVERYVDAICKELQLRKDELPDITIQTIYFGGGTPSQLSITDFEKVFSVINQYYRVDSGAEITLEANPDDLSEDYIRGLLQLPFNRISIGIQSFIDGELEKINRRHSAQQAKDAVWCCSRLGFSNISIDLMYGLPGQTLSDWSYNLNEAIKLPVQHISAYHLIYEKGTKLHSQLKAGKVKEADEQLSLDMFDLLRKKLSAHQFVHYEISNFALDKYFSKHNSSYWKGVPYLGIGASAHSYNGINRSSNRADLKNYIENIETGNWSPEIEKSNIYSRYNDLIITSLRTMWGLNLDDLKTQFGNELYRYCLDEARGFIDKKWLVDDGKCLKITDCGLFMSDAIMAQLMCVD
ncbi:radical SAM family heme chaperone HemW [Parabacteroides sp. FAFU027]|uniref:radical SAM family heme chaperone HemW n=1 Tax=Parabacteroides sp. FAFU027 TaxID=2922715 RepID=UPI001FAF5C01|nr:radical SAM family heme chaperone HemW [Parabacteroides sp. FAFU027]